MNTTYIGAGERGGCFKNVYDYALAHDNGTMLVVHGLVTTPEKASIAHAWIEDGDAVIDPTTGVKTGKERYYQMLQAQPQAKYDAMDAVGLTIRNKNHGPWTPEEERGKNIMKEEKENTKFDPNEVKVGTEEEKEHTNGDATKSEKIAKDHLKEPGGEHYYTKLNKAGLVNTPAAKSLAKKYLVNERQLKLISENVITETPGEYEKGDIITVLTPVENYGMLRSMGLVKHVDAIGTVRAEFDINGKPTIIPLNPAIDKIKKFDNTQQ